MDFSQDVLPPTLRPPASDTDKENEHTSSAFAIPVGEPSVSEPPRNPSEEPPLRGVPLPAHIVADIDALLGCATEKPAPEEVHQRHLSLTLPSRRDSPPVATHSAPPQPQGPDVGDKRKLARKKALVLVQQFQQSKRRREEGQTPTHSRTERAEPRTIFEDPLSLRPQPVKESQPQAEERVEEFRAALQEATQPTREKPASPPRALSEAEAAQNQHERERAVEVRAALGAVSQSDEGEEASTSSQVPEDVGNAWPLQSYPSVPTIPSDPLVGRVVKVYWPKYKNTYTGDVTDFDAVTGQHHIAYRDGEMKWTNLREEKWKLTDDVARVHRASPKKQRKASVSKGVTNNSSEGLQIGQRIEVLFDDPPGYFPGTITGKNKGRWQIEYDDGYREELDLSTTGRMHRKYRLLRGEGLIAGPRKALAKNARTWSPKHKATELTSPVLAHKESKKVKRLTNLVGNGTQSPAVSPPRHTVRVADPSPPRKSSKSKPKATSAKPPTGSNAVGSRVGVWWEDDKTFYYGTIKSFDKKEGKHQILYEDDNVQDWLLLAEEKLDWPDLAKTKAKPAEKQAEPEPPMGEAAVGWRVGVYWDPDKKYYYGVIHSFDAAAGTHAVFYEEDGTMENLDLSKVKIEWVKQTRPELVPKAKLSGNKRASASSGSSKPATKKAKTSAKPPTGSNAVGSRVGVWWEDDKTFYYGTIKSFDKKEGKHQILYEDGTDELISLAEEKLDWPGLAQAKAKAVPVSPKPKKKAQPQPPKGEAAVGWRVGVYWGPDKKYYYGVVHSYDKAAGTHLVVYEDSTMESLNLVKVKVQWVEVVPVASRPILIEAPAEEPPAKKAKAPKAKAGKGHVGKRVGIWWEDDACFYYGVLESYDESKGTHHIKYDDGTDEHLHLGEHKVDWKGKAK